jgi:UDP-N-acetylglucosamine--N-acetylmuramyl-(pentapeptide) pyrophosphoryl-undecaprenol N-acetylglucosamine transferase
LKSLFIIASFRPRLIVGTGGFGAAPVVFAAQILKTLGLSRARVVLHEQNAVPGRLNLLVGKWADMVLVTFPQTLKYFPENGCPVGYPVRGEIGTLSRQEGLERIDFTIPEGRTVVFAFGGSQGSRTINRALVDALGHLMPLKEEIFIVHGMGLFDTEDYHAQIDTEARLEERYTPEELTAIKGFYLSRDYFHNIEAVFAVSDFCVIRGGAGSLNEVAKAGLAAIIIPKAGLSGDHQVMNARAMAAAGLAYVIYEEPVLIDGRKLEAVSGRELADAVAGFALGLDRVREMGKRSRETFGGDPVASIVDAINSGECPEKGPGAGQAAIGTGELPGDGRLLGLLSKARAEEGASYAPGKVFPDHEDLAYLRKRAAGLLLSEAWQVRNLGVKLTGLLHDFEKIPVLCFMIKEKKPVAWYKRLLGGDFEQVGFIRRNALAAFRVMDRLNDDVEDALIDSFSDPYYEVRAEAARTAGHFGERFARQEEVEERLMELLDDRHFEVAEAAARALGRVGSGQKVLDRLLGFYDRRLWRLREAALAGIIELVERGRAGVDDEVLRDASRFLLTATDFRPHFSIKQTFKRLMDSLKREKGAG